MNPWQLWPLHLGRTSEGRKHQLGGKRTHDGLLERERTIQPRTPPGHQTYMGTYVRKTTEGCW